MRKLIIQIKDHKKAKEWCEKNLDKKSWYESSADKSFVFKDLESAIAFKMVFNIRDHPYLIDPSNGHLYGFPKPFDLGIGEDIHEWLIKNGYPEKEIRENGGVYYRLLG